MSRRTRSWSIALACAATTLASASSAVAAGFAAPDTPGPALSVAQDKLDAALQCSAKGVDHATRAPVLLVQGTGASAKDNWSWTYEPALDKLGIGWCAVDLPDHATGDVQVNGEYVVNAIRRMHARAGRRIAIIGHSQGGMVPRWALRFWPDTRPMVDDLIGFAPSNHGTITAGPTCNDADGCSAADWQQADTSQFMKALNSFAETWKGTSYTNVYTHNDEIVQPNRDATGSSSLHTGEGAITNVATQDLCPSDPYEHLSIGLVDPVAYALAVDALNHPGPADPKRIGLEVCAQDVHPGINRATYAKDASDAAADYAAYNSKALHAEPPLACYTTASCAPRTCRSRRVFTVHLAALRHARLTLDGKAVKLHRTGGRLTALVDLRGRGATVVVLRLRGRDARGRAVTLTRRYHPCVRRG